MDDMKKKERGLDTFFYYLIEVLRKCNLKYISLLLDVEQDCSLEYN